MMGQTNVTLGNSNCDLDFSFQTSNSTVNFKFDQSKVLAFNFGSQSKPITIAQGEISNIGDLADVSLIKSPSGTNLNLRTVGSSNQQIVLQTTQNDGTTYSSLVLDSDSIKIPGELEIYQNTGGGVNGKIYSYGYSRGLEVWAADYKTSKAQSTLVATFKSGNFDINSSYIIWDNTTAHTVPVNDSHL